MAVVGEKSGAFAAAAGCPHCTGTVPAGRLSLPALGTLLGKHAKLERGLLRTVIDLLVRPGRMLSAYFAGQRRRDYVNPVSYLLLAAATSLLMFGLYKSQYQVWAKGQLLGAAAGQPMPQGLSKAMQAYGDAVFEVSQYTTFTSTALALPLSALIWLLFRRSRINLAESLTLGLYAVGTGLFLHSLLIAPLFLAGMWKTGQHLGMALHLLLQCWIGLGYFGWSRGNVMRMAGVVTGGLVAGTFIVAGSAVTLIVARSLM